MNTCKVFTLPEIVRITHCSASHCDDDDAGDDDDDGAKEEKMKKHVESYESSDLCHVREIVCSVLHTVLFGRALGPVRPKDVDCPKLDVTYVHCGDKVVQREVNDRAEQLVSYLYRRRVPGGAGGHALATATAPGGRASPSSPRPASTVMVTVSFYEKRVRQSWFTKQQEKKYWEQWRLPIAVTDLAGGAGAAHAPGAREAAPPFSPSSSSSSSSFPDVDTVLRRGITRSQLQHCLLTAAGLLSEHREHIPPVCSSDALSFPVEIVIPSDADPGYGYGVDMLKRMLHSTPGLI